MANKENGSGLNDKTWEKVKAFEDMDVILIKATGKSYPRVKAWIRSNSRQLTEYSALKAICKALKITQEQAIQ